MLRRGIYRALFILVFSKAKVFCEAIEKTLHGNYIKLTTNADMQLINSFFDNDSAGIKAAEDLVNLINFTEINKASSVHLPVELLAKAITDPSDLVHKRNQSELINFLKSKKILRWIKEKPINFLWERYLYSHYYSPFQSAWVLNVAGDKVSQTADVETAQDESQLDQKQNLERKKTWKAWEYMLAKHIL